MARDPLHLIFEKFLFDFSKPEQTADDLVFDVVAEYIFHLMQVGHVPERHLDHVEEMVREEVTEIYRKKTYGSFNLQEFRQRHC